ncbi:acyltransferase family protein [Frankia sp. AgKG'84/4]|uniref:acyltransferase family protein n=1 Tax=Frankia sp. AgKG'84/4 TaxID=573490 RepID=UPI00200D5A81|nr:acyltransferase [Frankia sp. AgKG'84/4]MCL9793386.1 acyltransferase [Frankia sp. AgKG'84/4]
MDSGPRLAAHPVPAKPADPGRELRNRLESLTSLRFVAAVVVFLFHSSLEPLFSDPDAGRAYARVLEMAGWIGVSFFFVLSGFVLTWSARSNDTVLGVWRRRAVRIYPNHVVMWGVAIVLMGWAGGMPQWWQAVPNLFLVHSMIPKITVFSNLNDVSWSLSCEAFFYLLFPLLLRIVNRIRPERLWYWAGAVAAAVMLMPAVAQLLPAGPALPFDPTSTWRFWFVYVFPPVRTLDFVLGMIMARVLVERRWIGLRTTPAVALLVAAYLLALNVPFLYGLAAVSIVPMALLIPAAASADLAGRPSRLRAHGLVRLGEISFALYMVHRLVLVYGKKALGTDLTWSTPVALGVVAAAFGLCLTGAWLLSTFVEWPMVRLLGSPRADRRASLSDTPPDAADAPDAGDAPSAVDVPNTVDVPDTADAPDTADGVDAPGATAGITPGSNDLLVDLPVPRAESGVDAGTAP